MKAWVYTLCLSSGGLYVGACHRLETRLEDYLSGEGARQTVLDPPISMVYAEGFPSFVAVRRREAQLHEAELAQDFDPDHVEGHFVH